VGAISHLLLTDANEFPTLPLRFAEALVALLLSSLVATNRETWSADMLLYPRIDVWAMN